MFFFLAKDLVLRCYKQHTFFQNNFHLLIASACFEKKEKKKGKDKASMRMCASRAEDLFCMKSLALFSIDPSFYILQGMMSFQNKF